MSVAESIVLPAQPTSGQLFELPYGGDGLVAPHSAHVLNMSLTGDATGGTAIIRVHTDPRWCAVVSYALLRVSGLAADAKYAFVLTPGPGTTVLQQQGDIDFANLAGVNDGRMWMPPGVVGTTNVPQGPTDPMNIAAVVDNPGVAETLTLDLRVFNFHKDVKQYVPTQVILSSLPRGGSAPV